MSSSMRLILIGVFLLVMTEGTSAMGELRLERVMLSTGGIGYFDYATEVEGDA